MAACIARAKRRRGEQTAQAEREKSHCRVSQHFCRRRRRCCRHREQINLCFANTRYEHTVFARRGRRVDPLPYVAACIIHAGPYSSRDVGRCEIADGTERSKGPIVARTRTAFSAAREIVSSEEAALSRSRSRAKEEPYIHENVRIGGCNALHAYRSACRRFLPQTISAVPHVPPQSDLSRRFDFVSEAPCAAIARFKSMRLSDPIMRASRKNPRP